MKQITALLAVGVLGIGAALAQEAQVFEIYGVGSADPAGLMAMVRAAAGPDGHVTYDERQNRLLVLAPAEAQRQISEMMRTAVPPPVNVRLEVRFLGSSRRAESEASVFGEAGVVRESGITHSTIRLQPKVVQELSSQQSAVSQILVVSSGREASLRVGEEVPWLDWIMDYGRRHRAVVEQVHWQQVGSFLVVQPVVVGDQWIRLRITPELRGLAGGRPQTVRFAQVSTEVVIPDGQPYPLAGLTQGNEFMSHFLVGRRTVESSEALAITVTPRILAP